VYPPYWREPAIRTQTQVKVLLLLLLGVVSEAFRKMSKMSQNHCWSSLVIRPPILPSCLDFLFSPHAPRHHIPPISAHVVVVPPPH